MNTTGEEVVHLADRRVVVGKGLRHRHDIRIWVRHACLVVQPLLQQQDRLFALVCVVAEGEEVDAFHLQVHDSCDRCCRVHYRLAAHVQPSLLLPLDIELVVRAFVERLAVHPSVAVGEVLAGRAVDGEERHRVEVVTVREVEGGIDIPVVVPCAIVDAPVHLQRTHLLRLDPLFHHVGVIDVHELGDELLAVVVVLPCLVRFLLVEGRLHTHADHRVGLAPNLLVRQQCLLVLLLPRVGLKQQRVLVVIRHRLAIVIGIVQFLLQRHLHDFELVVERTIGGISGRGGDDRQRLAARTHGGLNDRHKVEHVALAVGELRRTELIRTA